MSTSNSTPSCEGFKDILCYYNFQYFEVNMDLPVLKDIKIFIVVINMIKNLILLDSIANKSLILYIRFYPIPYYTF